MRAYPASIALILIMALSLFTASCGDETDSAPAEIRGKWGVFTAGVLDGDSVISITANHISIKTQPFPYVVHTVRASDKTGYDTAIDCFYNNGSDLSTLYYRLNSASEASILFGEESGTYTKIL